MIWTILYGPYNFSYRDKSFQNFTVIGSTNRIKFPAIEDFGKYCMQQMNNSTTTVFLSDFLINMIYQLCTETSFGSAQDKIQHFIGYELYLIDCPYYGLHRLWTIPVQ